MRSHRFQVLFALALGVVVGIAVVSCTQQPSVNASKASGPPAPPAQTQFEYKVVLPVDGQASPKDAAERTEKEFNVLAADGWQFDGSLNTNGAVVFHRVKR